MRLDHVRLLVSRFGECFRFYRDIMELKVTWGDEGGGYASFDAGEGAALSIFPKQEMADVVGTSLLAAKSRSQDPLVLVFGVENLEATVNRLRSKGVEFVTAPADHSDWGIRTVHTRDPDGNLIEINSPLPGDQWTEDLRKAAGRDQPEV